MKHLLSVLAVLLIVACDATPPEERRAETWTGTMTVHASPLAAAADDALYVQVLLEYNDGYGDPYEDDAFLGTIAMWEEDPSNGCDLDFLPESEEPCRFVTTGEGLRTYTPEPANDSGTRGAWV